MEHLIRKGADLEGQNCLFGVHPAVMGKLNSFSLPYQTQLKWKNYTYVTMKRKIFSRSSK